MLDRVGLIRSVVVVLVQVVLMGTIGGAPHSALGQSPITGQKVRCEDGQADDYPCKNIDLLSYLPIDALGGGSGVELNDIWGWTDPQNGDEYALVARTEGVAFVDVSTPTEPVYLGELPTYTDTTTWRDVKVYENHAFIVSEAVGHGLQVFDLTQLRSVENPPVTFSETAHYDRFSAAHNIFINEETGYAYVVGITGSQDVPDSADDCGAGLHMVDVRSPAQPAFAGCFTDFSTGGQLASGYTHDLQCVVYDGPDADYQDREICFNANENELNIADVTDKDNPETITNVTYPQSGYVHQAWLTEDQKYLLVDDELDERNFDAIDRTRTMVFDVSDVDSPELVTRFFGETGAIDHNQYVVGKFSFQANYEAGLRILDVRDPENPIEKAYFDTYPRSNFAGFNGAWSNYPFFDSRIVIVSSIGEGLFVLQPRYSEIPIEALLTFEADRSGSSAQLRWVMSSNAETERFEVEHKPPKAPRWREGGTVEGQPGEGQLEYTYRVADLRPGTHQFRLRHINQQGETEISEPTSVQIRPEKPVALSAPVPNPVQEQATLDLTLREAKVLRIALYDPLGRRVATLHEGRLEAGTVQTVSIPATELSSGTYFLRVQGDGVNLTRKVVVAR